ncbi:MAG: NAD-dependent epimerase/dehydratase family protein [Pseudonocardia sp.]
MTGGAGFIGTHLCEYLIRSGLRVVVLDDLSTGSRDNAEYLAGLGADVAEMDVGESCRVPGPVDVLFHLACPASPADFARMPARIVRTGGIGVINALDEACRQNARMVYVSSSEVYGDPTETPQRESYRGNVSTTGVRSCYDESKRFGEAATAAYVRERKLDAGIVRPFNTYGPRMRADDGRVVPNFITQALLGADLTIYGDGRQTRSMCYVTDTVRAIAAMGRSSSPGPINVGGDQEITVSELAHTVLRVTASPAGVVFGPPAPDDPRRRRPDIRLAGAELGWRPEVSLTEGLAATVDWYRSAAEAVGSATRSGRHLR